MTDYSHGRVRNTYHSKGAFTDNKPFGCPKCGRCFTVKGNMTRHYKYECGQEPRFQCPYCEFRSTQTSNDVSHQDQAFRSEGLRSAPQIRGQIKEKNGRARQCRVMTVIFFVISNEREPHSCERNKSFWEIWIFIRTDLIVIRGSRLVRSTFIKIHAITARDEDVSRTSLAVKSFTSAVRFLRRRWDDV